MMRSLLWFGLAATLGLTVAAVAAERPEKEGGYRFSTDLSLGGPDASDDASFYEKFGPVALGADASGRMYVLDNGNARVQVFSPQGKFVATHGAEGDGPGEFRIPSRLAVNAGGEYAVYDLGQGRVSVFAPDGKLRWDLLAPTSVADLALADDGRLFVGYDEYGPAQVEVYGRDGKLAWSAGPGSKAPGRVIKLEIGVQTLAPRLAMNGANAFVRAPKGDYDLELWTKGQAQPVRWTRPLERRAFTAEELAPPKNDDDGEGGPEVIMIRRSGPGGDDGGGGGGTEDVEAWADHDAGEISLDPESLKQFMPTHHAATRGVLAWKDGRVWVLTSELARGGSVVDEWSKDGRWVRRFTLPEEVDWITLGADGRLYTVTHDEDDYPTVHRVVLSSEA